MSKQRLVEKNYEVMDNSIRITEVIEKELTAHDLLREKLNYRSKQEQIIQQMNQLQQQYEAFETAIAEVDEMLSTLPEPEPITKMRPPAIPIATPNPKNGG